MLKNSLPIQFPKQVLSQYSEYTLADANVPKVRWGNIPKTSIPSDATIQYVSFNSPRGEHSCVRYNKNGGTTRLEEYTRMPTGGPVNKHQELKDVENMSVKTNTVSRKGNEYSSTHILDRETGVESVARRKGKEIIGGYDVIPTKQTFAQGFKGRLQKLGMTIATDVNGCERPVLKNIGEMILKVAKRIK